MRRGDRDRLQGALVALADGDRRAFDTVWRLAEPVVRSIAARIAGTDAEDAAQIALIKVFERASDFDPNRDALAWIAGVAAWEARTVVRRRHRRREDRLTEVVEPRAERAALVAELHQALQELGPLDRETLEAAMGWRDRPDISGATFRKRLQRARSRLSTLWRERHG